MLAAADLQTIPASEQPFILYAYHPEAIPIRHGAFAYAANTAFNQLAILTPALLVGDGHLSRINLRGMAHGRELGSLLDRLENIAPSDPFFHKRGILRNGHRYFLKEPCDPYTADNGKVYDYRTVAINREDQFALHLAEHGMENILLLHGLTGRDLPIVRADWLQNIALSTIHVGLTKGLYYEFRGIKGLNLNQILEKYGASQALVDKLDSDSFAAVLASGVTDRGRRIVAFYGTGVKPTAGLPLILITLDIGLADVNEEQDPILNILNSKVTAKEIFIILPSGLILFVLTNGEDVLQDFAPDQVAHDKEVPHPSPQTLIPAVSCISCHTAWGPEDAKAKMFIEFENDVRDMYRQHFSRTKQGAILDELGKRKGSLANLFKAYSKYSGDLKNVLRLAAISHSAVTFELTGESITDIGKEIDRSRDEYCYAHVDSRRLLYDLGDRVVAEGKDTLERARFMAKRFAEIVPPPPADEDGFSEIDGRLLPLYNELRQLTITPAQREAVFADAALIRWENIKRNREGKP